MWVGVGVRVRVRVGVRVRVRDSLCNKNQTLSVVLVEVYHTAFKEVI